MAYIVMPAPSSGHTKTMLQDSIDKHSLDADVVACRNCIGDDYIGHA